MIKWQFANSLLKREFSVCGFNLATFCYEIYEYKEQTGLKLQLGSSLKFSFLYAFSLAVASCGNTFCLKPHFAAAYFSLSWPGSEAR